MDFRRALQSWPVLRQLSGPDVFGRGAAVQLGRSAALEPRTTTADRVVQSVCPVLRGRAAASGST